MRTWMSALALLAALPPKIAAGETPSPIVGHIEFLWSAPVTGSGARPVALGLLTRPEAPHLACWKTRDFPQRAVEVRLELDDDGGRHALWTGTEHGASRFVRCDAIDLAALGVAPGMRRVTLRFDGRVAAAIVMDVAERLESSGFVQGDRMFVDGRTDSPEELAAADYAGRFM
ncbi:hypothetical protein PQS31_02265 [Luteimonas sp BLCC-B24]|uniref:hypothetical protein n=1 Tax=Luteimonas sp. BLCC-B24 TaxID=3025317 RepID=UPI00234E2170|nr:hypothetical protein [Luteimonas sp. BLCC-B24]MDC7805649.1 hypothetical protein [Luteimonas sp. BLCC-B24]